MKTVKVFAPASVANVACGFDTMGFALDQPGDTIIAKEVQSPGLHIASIIGDNGKLPLDPLKNTVSVAAQSLMNHLGFTGGIALEIHKGLPIGSGLGSSAASAVAGAFAINELLGSPLEKAALLPFALDGEAIASKARHADNVAPCLLGGFILVRDHASQDFISIPTPAGLYAAVVMPQVEVLTADARAVLPREIPLSTAITQWSNLGALISAMFLSDYELIGRSLQDVIVEPARSVLIPHFYEVKESALTAGALGGSISGAGPAIFALCKGEAVAQAVAQAMKGVFRAHEVPSLELVSPINGEGVKVIGGGNY